MTNRERRDAIRKAVLDNITAIDCAQECPNTFVVVYSEHDGQPYSAFGFAKVQWPDRWDSSCGVKMAVSKAVMKVVRAIMAGVPLEDGFDVITDYTIEDANG